MAILIVDPSPDSRLRIRSILTKAGHSQILEADSAQAAFTTLNLDGSQLSIEVDLIIMETLLPDIGGAAALRRIKQKENLSNIPIIMVTKSGDLESLKDAFSAGAMDYISKPFKAVELLARVSTAVTMKREFDAHGAREQELLGTNQKLMEALEQVPSRTINKVFISYRRADSTDVTRRIYDRLIQVFPQSVFRDVDSIPFGVDFRMYLDEQVTKCDVVLVVIGMNWLRRTGQSGLEDPNDFVRVEIELALKRQIRVIPVLVGGAVIPQAEQLPASIQDLSFRHGIVLRPDPVFDKDMDRLIADLK